MENLLQIKEKLKSVYGKYDSYFLSVIKFLLALVTFLMINKGLGYFQKLNNIVVTLILALFCSFLPVNAIVLIGLGLLAVQLYGLSMTAAIVGGALILIILLLHFGIAPKYGYALIITPLALAFQIPCAVPLVLGLCASPLAGVGTVFGVILFYGVNVITKTDVPAAANTAASGSDIAGLAIIEEIKVYLDAILKNTEMIVMVITLLAVLLVVYVIRKMAIKHAWSVAIGAGAFTYLAVTVIGRTTLELELDLFWMILGTVISVIIAVVLEFFVLGVDYRRTESVQFEDDDYYYYVKAVPKMKTAAAMKEANGRRKAEERSTAGASRTDKGRSGGEEGNISRRIPEERASVNISGPIQQQSRESTRMAVKERSRENTRMAVKERSRENKLRSETERPERQRENMRRPEGEQSRAASRRSGAEAAKEKVQGTERRPVRLGEEPLTSEERQYRRTSGAVKKPEMLDVPNVQRPPKGMGNLSEIERRINSQMNAGSHKEE